MQEGETEEQNGARKSFYSRIDERSNEMLLLVYRPLDFEVTSQYTLTIKAAVRGHFQQFSNFHFFQLKWIF